MSVSILFGRKRKNLKTAYELSAAEKCFLPVSVAKEDRLDYYNALDKYAAEGDLQPFMELVATLEEKQLDKYLAHVQEQEMKAPTQTM